MNTFAKELRAEHAHFMSKQKMHARIKREDHSMLREDEFHYSDASKYAEQYYGETYRATTGLDNDWGDY